MEPALKHPGYASLLLGLVLRVPAAELISIPLPMNICSRTIGRTVFPKAAFGFRV
jgi:hypothetical protein